MSSYILGVKVDTELNEQTALSEAVRLVNEPGTHYISTTNPEFIISAQGDGEFKRVINESDLSIPDGIGVLFADYYSNYVKRYPKNIFYPVSSFIYGVYFGLTSLMKKYSVGQRVSGADLMERLCKYASENGKSVFLLGGMYKNPLGQGVEKDEDMANRVAQVLRTRYPGINIIGASSAYRSSPEDDTATLDFIHDCMKKAGVDKIDFLFVAYNHPKQEKWISRNKDKIPAKLSMGVGGTFDYISGSKSRCPKALQDAGLEWLYKLITQPWRIKRIYKAFPTFPYLVYKSTL